MESGVTTKFNKYERVAGLFVLGAVGGAIFALFGMAMQRGWFDAKTELETSLKSADGVRVGTSVIMAGLRAGSVTRIELQRDNEIRVSFEIADKFLSRVRDDSVARVVRPFVIGEKVLELTVGAETSAAVVAGQKIQSEPTADLMDLISGRTLAPYLASLGKMMENLRFVAEALLAPERSRQIVKIFDELAPLLRNSNSLLRETNAIVSQVNKKQQLVTMISGLAEMTAELRRALPAARAQAPELARDLSKIARNMAVMSDELQKALPLMRDAVPELPRASRRALEALDETVVTLKALQKSFLLRGNAREVREEEALADRRREAQERKPAAEAPKDGRK